MHKLFAAITFAFLLGITLMGCSKEITDLRKALVENSRPVGVQTADVWANSADLGE